MTTSAGADSTRSHGAIPGQLTLDLFPHPDDERAPSAGRPTGRMTAREHLYALHRGTPARVTLVVGKDFRRARHYSIAELEAEASALRGLRDVYVSQSSFWGRRKVVNLARLGALWADLDYYRRPELAARLPLSDYPSELGRYVRRYGPEHPAPQAILDMALEHLERGYTWQGERRPLPAPSFAVSTGRGLALVWLHTHAPRMALPRWRLCQAMISGCLAPLGADAGATDPARVLRLAESRHGITGRAVEVIAGSGSAVWEFDALADEVLPIPRAQYGEYRSMTQARTAAKKAARQRPDRVARQLADLTPKTLNEAYLSDLQELAELRWFGRIDEGYRSKYLYVAASSLAWLVPAAQLESEVLELARRATNYGPREARGAVSSVVGRAKMAAAGKRLPYAGGYVDPRYKIGRRKVVELLEITPEKQERIRALIGDDERRRRDRIRHEKARRAAGAMTREQYEVRAQERREEARRMAAEGLSLRQVAARLGISKSQVQRALKTGT